MQNQQLDVESVFMEALQIHSPEDRRAYLDQQCDDVEMRRQIEDLLRAHEDAGSFLESPPVGLAATIAPGEFETVDDYTCEVSLGFLAASDKSNCLGTLGQYEVIDVVGRGGMGLVFRAYDTKLNRVVAIKVMAPALAANAMAVKRFLREARSAAAVSHDHVVTIHAIEETNDPPFIVMEFVEGQSLQEKVDQQGAFELKEILRIGMQIASGLEAAHQQGLVHRDIKPANILLEDGVERVKITDFGLARAVDDIGVTQTGQIAGTPQYMSPEQAQGHAVDHRTDLFSLGSVLYTMCTGRAAFRADNAVAVLRRVADESPRPIHDVNSEIPAWLERIVEKLLAKDANDRFGSADEVANLLRGHLAHLQHPTTEPQPQPVSVTKPAKPVATNSRPGAKGISRYVTLALILIGLICGGAAVVYVQTDKGTLVIESPSDDVEVVVSKGGKQIRVVDTSNGSVVVRLPSGAYEVALRDDDHFMISKGQIAVIKRGEEVRVSIRPKPSSATNAQASVTTEQGSGTAVVTVKSDAEVTVMKRQNTVVKRSGEFHASIRPRPSSTSDAQAATAAATAWLNLLDSGSFDDCYDKTSPKMRQMVSKRVFVQAIQGALRPLGSTKKRNVVTTRQASYLRSFGDGSYVQLSYLTEFEQVLGMTEFVTMSLDEDGVWRVLSYAVQRGLGSEMRHPKSKEPSNNSKEPGEASSDSDTKASEYFRRLSADLDKQVVRVISKNGITKIQPAAPFGTGSMVGKRMHSETGVRVVFDGDWKSISTANKALLAEFERIAADADASIDSRETLGSPDSGELNAFKLHYSTDQGHGVVNVTLENTRTNGSSKELKDAHLVVTVEEWTQPATKDPYGLIRRRTSGPNPSNSLPRAEANNTTQPEIDAPSAISPKSPGANGKERNSD